VNVRLGMFKMVRVLVVSVTLAMGWVSGSVAASFDCNKARLETEVAICSDPILFALNDLAQAISPFVGLKLDLSNKRNSFEELADQYSIGISRLMGFVSIFDVQELSASINSLEQWSATISSGKKVIQIRPSNKYTNLYSNGAALQEGIILYGDKSFPDYALLAPSLSAVRENYTIDGNILTETGYARPARFENKYRFQNGCWRLIGFDNYSNDLISSEGRIKTSINYLTGNVIEVYENKTNHYSFIPKVWCIQDGYYDINQK